MPWITKKAASQVYNDDDKSSNTIMTAIIRVPPPMIDYDDEAFFRMRAAEIPLLLVFVI